MKLAGASIASIAFEDDAVGWPQAAVIAALRRSRCPACGTILIGAGDRQQRRAVQDLGELAD